MSRLLETTTIPEFIKVFKSIYSMTREDLAEKLDTHADYIANIEKGKKKKPVLLAKNMMPLLIGDERLHLAGLIYQTFAIEYESKIREAEKELGITLEAVDAYARKSSRRKRNSV